MNIQESMQGILRSEAIFGEQFYPTFFSRCPEAREYFEGTDMKRQALVITMTMTLIEQHYSNGYAAVKTYLQYLGTRHHTRAIGSELYTPMRDAMLEALEQFHQNDWDDNLARQWREAIDGASEEMLKGYKERVTL